jgi:TnpA family transposase
MHAGNDRTLWPIRDNMVWPSLFTLNWLEDPHLRRRHEVGLNKGEAKNGLARVIFFNRLGEIRDRSYENQRYRASALNLDSLEHGLHRPRRG